jgi:2-succinyl-5-enolpyruvyl-6-hydroxy-3-cyclohexene-1-carboxylate synthase
MSVQATFAATLVDEWARGGVTDAVICPGSRSTPMAVALAERLRVHVRLDERSAAFYALGLAVAQVRPVVICVTSGTAAAELHPAVVEAHQGLVPLIVCTADRPPELHHVGASQTIDQVGLFTTATRWSCHPGVPGQAQAASWRPLAVRALAEAEGGPPGTGHGPGPVHLNLAFREPLGGGPDRLPERAGPRITTAAPTAVAPVVPLVGRGLLIAGAGAGSPSAVASLGAHLGWPVLADPRSGCRVPGSVAAADAIVRAGIPFPETVLVLGGPWLSKALAAYVESAATSGARVVAVDPWRSWTDPNHVVSEFHQVDPDAFLAAALEAADGGAASTDGGQAGSVDHAWKHAWDGYEQAAQRAIDDALGDALSEPAVARALIRHAAASGSTVLAAASMPVRDLEWFAPAVAAPPTVLANRGANGIDGVVSTALGVAAAGRRTVALLGDLAFLHDVSGLVNFNPASPCTFVVLDNGGGGIFSFLPQADELDHERFELLFGTPPTSDVGRVAAGFGLAVHEVTTMGELAEGLAVAAPCVLRVRVPDRAANAALHARVNEAVSAALAR